MLDLIQKLFTLHLLNIYPSVRVSNKICFTFIADVNECTDRTDDCHPTRAFCSDTEDSFTCTCFPGYTGDGRVCEGG